MPLQPFLLTKPISLLLSQLLRQLHLVFLPTATKLSILLKLTPMTHPEHYLLADHRRYVRQSTFFLLYCYFRPISAEDVVLLHCSLSFCNVLYTQRPNPKLTQKTFDKFRGFLRDILLPVPNPHSGELTPATSSVNTSPLLFITLFELWR